MTARLRVSSLVLVLAFGSTGCGDIVRKLTKKEANADAGDAVAQGTSARPPDAAPSDVAPSGSASAGDRGGARPLPVNAQGAPTPATASSKPTATTPTATATTPTATATTPTATATTPTATATTPTTATAAPATTPTTAPSASGGVPAGLYKCSGTVGGVFMTTGRVLIVDATRYAVGADGSGAGTYEFFPETSQIVFKSGPNANLDTVSFARLVSPNRIQMKTGKNGRSLWDCKR